MKKVSTLSGGGGGRWFSVNEDKAWAERFFLWFSVYWIGVFAWVVVSGAYLAWRDAGYATIGLVLAVPPWLAPAVLRRRVQLDSYWFKANVWMAIFGFVGNYFWTHYFYTVLGARYSFPVTWFLNGVPVLCYLITHAYFISYHTFSTLLLRRLWTSRFHRSLGAVARLLVSASVVLGVAYLTAFMEAFTLENFPYYEHTDRWLMYKYGSAFYALYFIVSFPMFARLDEDPTKPWTLSQAAIDAFAAAMIVFILCDFWRLFIGRLPGVPERLCLPWQ